MAEPETKPYSVDAPFTNQNEGIYSIKFAKSLKGLLMIAIIVLLLLGYICAASISRKGADAADACNITGVKVNVRSCRIAYCTFSMIGVFVFLFLFLVNTINVRFLERLRAIMDGIITVAIIAFFALMMFITSCPQAAAEKRVGRAIDRCHFNIRRGGPGASCFFGLVAVIAMGLLCLFTFTRK